MTTTIYHFKEKPDTSTSVDIDVLEEEEFLYYLIIYNDDYNTFAWVIETLVQVCEHTVEQAEQCAWIIHTKGKCIVKEGDYKYLEPMKDAICSRGIDAKIEQ